MNLWKIHVGIFANVANTKKCISICKHLTIILYTTRKYANNTYLRCVITDDKKNWGRWTNNNRTSFRKGKCLKRNTRTGAITMYVNMPFAIKTSLKAGNGIVRKNTLRSCTLGLGFTTWILFEFSNMFIWLNYAL